MSRSDVAKREDGLAIRGSVQDNAYQAYQLHLGGKDWEDVAIRLGYANGKTAQVEVRQYITRAAVQMDTAKREEVLYLEMARLDALQSALWDDAMEGDTKAVDSILRVMGHRAKLLGLELMAGVDTSVTSRTVIIQGDTQDYIRSLQLVTGGKTE